MMGWERVTLAEIVTKIGSGATPTGGNSNYKEEGISLIRSQNVHDLRFAYSGLAFIDDEQAKELNNVTVKSGDVLLNITGDSVARVCLVTDQVLPARVNQHVAIVRADTGKADNRYLLFYLFYIKDYLLMRGQGGSTRNALTKSMIEELKIPLPPLPLQRRIADILGRYDALIDNYQRQITALENMAQEIYREWFVRGRCPYAEPGENGGLPVGWERKTLGDVASDNRQMVRIENVAPDTPYVGLEHLSVKSIIIKDSGTVEDVDSDKLLFRTGDILFGKIRAYLHKVCLSHFDGVCSSDTIVIRPTIEHALGFILFTVFDDHFIEFADMVSNGTKMPRSEWKVLKSYEIVVPTPDALQAFDKIAVSAFSKIINLQTQLTTLRQTRDALLPRLLSGQLAVGETLAD